MARAGRRIVASLLLAGLAAGGSGCGRETAPAPTVSGGVPGILKLLKSSSSERLRRNICGSDPP